MEPRTENSLPINSGGKSYFKYFLVGVLTLTGCRSNQSQTLPIQPPESCQASVTAENSIPTSVTICISYDSEGGILLTVPEYQNYPFILMLRKDFADTGDPPDYYYDREIPGEKGIRFPPDVVNADNLPTGIGITIATPENPLLSDEISYVPFPDLRDGEGFTLIIPVSTYTQIEPTY